MNCRNKFSILPMILIGLFLLPSYATARKYAYVFSFFDTTKEAAGLRLAYSYDGFNWTAINNNKPILNPTVGKDKLMRDPSICQAPDGTFHMVWTTSWTDNVIGHASSRDLIHWSEQETIPVMVHESTTRNSWAPELFYEKKTKLFWIFWASTVPGAKDVKIMSKSESDYNHRIYACYTKDFKTYSKTQLWFNPDFSAIDAAVVQDPKTGELIMAVKNENLVPEEKNIRITRTKSMEEGFPIQVSEPIHKKGLWCEGPSPIFIGKDLVVYYDNYREHKYGASISHDHGHTWEDCTDRISMPEGMSHGTAFRVKKSIVDALAKY